MSNPYPMLHRLDGRLAPGIPASLLPGVMRSVRSVERRTEFRAWYNTTSLTLVSTPECWYKGQINQVNVVRGDTEKGDHIELHLQTKLSCEANASSR